MATELERAMRSVEGLASWSDWVPFAGGAEAAPRLPGVYMIRDPRDSTVVHTGMGGERAGSRGTPKGIWVRLAIYLNEMGATPGFGEAAVLERLHR